MPPLIAWGAALALAADPVLVQDGVEDARTTVARAAGRATDTLEIVDATGLRSGDPRLDGHGAGFQACEGEPTHAARIVEAIQAIESALDYAEAAEATDHAAAALAALPCLAEPVPASLGAKLHFLRGLAAWEQHDEQAALAAFRHAHAWAPALAWDDTYPPDARHLFDRARHSTGTEHVLRLPGRPGAGLWIDGQPPDGDALRLPPGIHLVQWGSARSARSVGLRLDARGASALWVPTALDDPLDWLGTDRQPALSGLVSHALPGADPVFAATRAGVWQGSPATDRWEPLEVPDPPRPIRRAAFWTGTVGLGVLAGGAVATAITWAQAHSVYEDGTAPDVTWRQFERARASYPSARADLARARGVAVAGGLVGAVGVTVHLASRR